MAVKYGRTPAGGTYIADPGAPNNASGDLDSFDPWTGKYTPPDGFEWDPVASKYDRTPVSAGTRENQYKNAASGGLLNSLSGMLSGISGGGGGTGSTAAFGVGGSSGGGSGTSGAPGAPGGTGNVAPLQMPDTTGAQNSAFAVAKDRVGQQSRAALNSLNDELGANGMLGSGAQVQGARDIIESGAGELGNVRRQQAITQSNNAQDTAKTNYAGSLTQRGQDIQQQEAQAQLELQRNNANAQRQMQLLTLALSGLSGGSAGSLY